MTDRQRPERAEDIPMEESGREQPVRLGTVADLETMSLKELLYYVLVGSHGRAEA